VLFAMTRHVLVGLPQSITRVTFPKGVAAAGIERTIRPWHDL